MTFPVLWLWLVMGILVMGILVGVTNQDAECTHQGYQLKVARFGNEVHKLCLKLVKIGRTSLVSESAAIFLDPDAAAAATDNSLQDLTMAYGYPVRAPHSGSAEGYIGEDNQFYGVLHIGHRTLHADPYGKDDRSRQFGAFEGEHILDDIPRMKRHQAQVNREQRIRTLFTNQQMSDCKPSSFLRPPATHLHSLVGKNNDSIVLELWLRHLPNDVQRILAVHQDLSLDKVGDLADSIVVSLGNTPVAGCSVSLPTTTSYTEAAALRLHATVAGAWWCCCVY